MHIYILPQCSTTAASVLNSAGMDAQFERSCCAISRGILKETQTNMYRIRKRNFVIMFLFPLLNDHGLCCCLAKVVHGELCENFLVNEVHLF